MIFSHDGPLDFLRQFPVVGFAVRSLCVALTSRKRRQPAAALPAAAAAPARLILPDEWSRLNRPDHLVLVLSFLAVGFDSKETRAMRLV
jgi:hypothetical protein